MTALHELDLLDEATARLAVCLLRESLWRMRDGRLPLEPPPPGDGRSLGERIAEAEADCRARAEVLRVAYREQLAGVRLIERLGLDAVDVDLLALAAAAQAEPALAHAIAALRPPGVEAPLHAALLASLATDDRDGRVRALARLESGAPLRRWNLLACRGDGPLAGRVIVVPEHAAALLRGDAPIGAIEPGLALALRAIPERDEPRLGSPAFALARASLGAVDGPPVALVIASPDRAGRARFAAAAAGMAGHGLVELAIDLLPGDPHGLDLALRGVVRTARLGGTLIALAGLERLPAEELERRLAIVGRALDVLGDRAPLVALADRPVAANALAALGRDTVTVEPGVPDPQGRIASLTAALGAARRELAPHLPSQLDPAQLAEAARLYPLPPDALDAAARTAVRAVTARDLLAPGASLDGGDLLAAMRAQLDHRMASLADPVRTRVGFADLVVEPEAQDRLREILVYVRHAAQVYDRWGFGARVPARGVSALFSGPPGTGKTMSAAVLATELGLELFRIDLSRVVSKYIGETESNLARVFAEAQASRAILLFDEADSLFGKRTDVKSSVDRYANMEINYLLQRMESFDGISILTTNLEHAMDDAFKRRLHFRVRFEAPDAAMRGRLWQKLVPTEAERARDVDLAALGHRFEMSGGHIRNAALRAAFLASGRGRVIDQATLVEAAEREIDEMGRVTAVSSRAS